MYAIRSYYVVIQPAVEFAQTVHGFAINGHDDIPQGDFSIPGDTYAPESYNFV